MQSFAKCEEVCAENCKDSAIESLGGDGHAEKKVAEELKKADIG